MNWKSNISRVQIWPYYTCEKAYCKESPIKDLVIKMLKILAKANNHQIFKEFSEINEKKILANFLNDTNLNLNYYLEIKTVSDLFERNLDRNNQNEIYFKILFNKDKKNLFRAIKSKSIIEELNFLYSVTNITKINENIQVSSSIQIDDLIERLIRLLDFSQELKDILNS